MKKNILPALIFVAALAYSCNVAKTCPTYAKAPKQGIETASRR